jgi:tetratricopeptide (TPR) repeat protein
LEINPRLAEAYVNRSAALNQQGDYVGAIVDVTKVLEINPRLPEAYFNRADARLLHGDRAGARADLNKALELTSKPELQLKIIQLFHQLWD